MINSGRERQTGHVTRINEGRNVFKILAGKPTGNKHLGMSKYRLENNIRIYLK